MTFTPTRGEITNLAVLCLLCALAVLPLASHLLTGDIPENWLAEDGVYESLGALAVFIGSIVCLVAYRFSGNNLRNRNPWLLLLSLGLFFLGGEEISWGQRLFNLDVSKEVLQSNYQQEFNLHNARFLQSHNNQLSMLLAQLLVVYLIFLPLFSHGFPSAARLLQQLRVPIPSLPIALAALVAKNASNITLRAVHGATIPESPIRIGEMFESQMQFCLLWCACLFLYREIRNSQ